MGDITMKNGYISITQKCSHNCLACPCGSAAKQYKDLSLDKIQKTIQCGIQEKMIDRIIVSGGEPMFHPQFFEILEFLVSTELTISLLTTCEAISDKKFLDQILKLAPVHRLRITTAIHSFKSGMHDFMTNCPGSFIKSMNGVHNAISAGIPTSIKYLISGYTYRDMQEYVIHYYNTFPNNVSLAICNLDLKNVEAKQIPGLKVPFVDLKPYLESALDYVIEQSEIGRKRTVKVFDTPYCAIDSQYWTFLQSLQDYSMSVFNAPFVNEHKVRFNISSDVAPIFEPCKRCKLKSSCPGTWSSAKEVFGEEVFNPFV